MSGAAGSGNSLDQLLQQVLQQTLEVAGAEEGAVSGRAEEGAEEGAEPMDQEAVVAHEVAASTTSLMESLVDQGADLSALLNAVTANPIFEAGDGPGSELRKLCQMKGGCVESCGRGCILQLCFRLRTLLCGSTKSVVASRMYGGLAVSMGMEGPLFWETISPALSSHLPLLFLLVCLRPLAPSLACGAQAEPLGTTRAFE